MDNMGGFSIYESILEAWEILKGNLGKFVLLFVIFSLACEASGLMLRFAEEGTPLYYLLEFIIFCIGLFFTEGFIKANLQVLNGSQLDIMLLFKSYRSLLRLLLAIIIIWLLNMIALPFLLIPSVIIIKLFHVGAIVFAISMSIPLIVTVVKLSFTFPLIIDQDLDVIDAIKTSWKMTNGNFWALFGLFLTFILILAAGLLALVVGILVAFPLVYLSYFSVYKKLLPNEIVDDYSSSEKIPL